MLRCQTATHRELVLLVMDAGACIFSPVTTFTNGPGMEAQQGGGKWQVSRVKKSSRLQGERTPRAGHGNAEDRARRGPRRAASCPLLQESVSCTQSTFSRYPDICLSYF